MTVLAVTERIGQGDQLHFVTIGDVEETESQGVKARYEYPPLSGVVSSGNDCVEKEIKGGNPAVPGNDEISPGVGRRLARAARYPLDPPAVAQFLGLGNWLISKVRVSCPDRARDAINLVAATVRPEDRRTRNLR